MCVVWQAKPAVSLSACMDVTCISLYYERGTRLPCTNLCVCYIWFITPQLGLLSRLMVTGHRQQHYGNSLQPVQMLARMPCLLTGLICVYADYGLSADLACMALAVQHLMPSARVRCCAILRPGLSDW